MWFQFPENEEIISVERQTFITEYTNNNGDRFFRAPDHFREKLVRDGGCKALIIPPEGVPDNLPPLAFPETAPGADDKVLMIQQELSNERSTSTALRAELGAALHERDQLRFQVHELTEELNDLKEKMEDQGLEIAETPGKRK